MEDISKQARVNVGPQGRIVIPAGLRKELGIERGDVLIVRIEDGRLVLQKRRDVLGRVRKRFGKVPREVSLVDELISERRKEAFRETAAE